MTEITVFTVGHQARRTGQLVIKRLELPDGFQARVLKGDMRGEGHRQYDQLLDIFWTGWW